VPSMRGPQDYRVHKNNCANLGRALAERLMYNYVGGAYVPLAEVSESLTRQRMQKYVTRLCQAIPATTSVPLAEVPEMYRGRKRVVMEAAVQSLQINRVCAADAICGSFVKGNEKFNFSDGKDPKPRAINPRHPRYVASCACFLKHSEKLVYQGIARMCGEPVVMKGYNAVDTAFWVKKKFDRLSDPVAVGFDATAFDKHVAVAHLTQVEHAVYRHMFRNDPRYDELDELLNWQLVNTLRANVDDGKLKTKVRGRRMSGDLNTSLGNCLLMCGMMWAYARTVRVRIDLVNNGDDCVCFMERRDYRRFVENAVIWFAELGFPMKVEEPCYVLEHVEFCQTRPVWNGTDYVMCRSPFAAVMKDSCTVVDVSHPKQFDRWMSAVGGCGCSLTSGVPVMYSYYSVYTRSSSGNPGNIGNHPSMTSGLTFMAGGMVAEKREITDDARVSFWLAFGITPDEQIMFEQYYTGLILYHDAHPIEVGYQTTSHAPLWLAYKH